ncbi:MAG: hypothetical protein ACOX78_01725 [Lachnospiraceae bacterium]|jgi:hypothetical protein
MDNNNSVVITYGRCITMTYNEWYFDEEPFIVTPTKTMTCDDLAVYCKELWKHSVNIEKWHDVPESQATFWNDKKVHGEVLSADWGILLFDMAVSVSYPKGLFNEDRDPNYYTSFLMNDNDTNIDAAYLVSYHSSSSRRRKPYVILPTRDMKQRDFIRLCHAVWKRDLENQKKRDLRSIDKDATYWDEDNIIGRITLKNGSIQVFTYIMPNRADALGKW